MVEMEISYRHKTKGSFAEASPPTHQRLSAALMNEFVGIEPAQVHIGGAFDENFGGEFEIAQWRADGPKMQAIEPGLKISAQIEIDGFVDRGG